MTKDGGLDDPQQCIHKALCIAKRRGWPIKSHHGRGYGPSVAFRCSSDALPECGETWP
jgi:hypothetical protein